MRAVLKLVQGLTILSITAGIPATAQAAKFPSASRPAIVFIDGRLHGGVTMACGKQPTLNGTTGAPHTSAILPYTTVFEPIPPRTLGAVRLVPVSFDGRHVGLASSPT